MTRAGSAAAVQLVDILSFSKKLYLFPSAEHIAFVRSFGRYGWCMGRGSYLGGSTIIYPGGWGFSRLDPVPSKKNKANSVGAKNRSRKAEGPKSQPKNKDWRAEFLSAVIAAEVYERPAPSLSKQAPPSLWEELKPHATSFDWARAQKEYPEHVERFAARKSERDAKKNGPSLRALSASRKEVALPTRPKSPSSVPVQARAAEIADAIGFHERKLVELKAEYKRLIGQLWK